jgi:hypothetical protein
LAKLRVFSDRYDACKSSAFPVGNSAFLKVCDVANRGAYADGILYDSGDEIAKPPAKRRSLWWKVALCHDGFFDQEVFDVHRLDGHFYYIKYDFGKELAPKTHEDIACH